MVSTRSTVSQAHVISAMLLLLWGVTSLAFQPFQIISSSRRNHPSHVVLFSTSSPDTDTEQENFASAETKKTSTTTTKEEKLSEMDSRVLKSMLQDTEKLDLKTEENLKKLLERGVVSKEVPRVDTEKSKKDEYANSEFSSEALKKLSDTKLWKSLSRKAGDWLESAKLYVVNRVERDALTIAALGSFAWERAARDVARALPAAGNSTQAMETRPRKTFMLSEKSSVEEMATPIDELKSVGSTVADILRTGGTDGASSFATTSSTGVLRSAARSRQDKRNFQRAYQRSQENKSNPFKTTKRATAGVVDTAWELRRELQAEANKPGYKTKEVQNALGAASESTRQLLTGAQETWRLGRAKQRERKSLKEHNDIQAEMGTADGTVVSPADYIDADAIFFATTEPPKEETQKVKHESAHVEDASYEAEKQKRLRIQELRADQEALRAQELERQKQELLMIYSELETECRQLREHLQSCIVSPEETWLRTEVIDCVREFDQALIRQVVTEMIETRNSLKEVLARHNEEEIEMKDKVQQLLSELVAAKTKMDEIEGHAQQAVSLGASQALNEILTDRSSIESENMVPVLLRLDEIKHQLDDLITVNDNVDLGVENAPHFGKEDFVDSEAVHGNAQPNGWAQHGTEGSEREFIDQFTSDEGVSSSSKGADIMDVIPEAFMYAVATTPTTPSADTEVETDKAPTDFVSSMAELVTDDDFEAAVGEYKRVEAVNDGDEDALEDSKKKEENVVFTLFLRSLDIIFFLLEKTFTVALPTVVSSSLTAKDRLDNVAQGGLGSKGWKPIGSAQAGARRY